MQDVYTEASIGRLTFPNRVLLAPMVTCLASIVHEVTDVMIRHYVRIAKGGAGGIIVESTLVNDNDHTMSINELHISSDRYIPGLTRLAEAISDAGSVPILQINCHDRYSPDMPAERIAAIAEEFGFAAKRAKTAGFKAVEIHSCHNNFCCEILSPTTNGRDDSYGGTLVKNAQFVKDCITHIRKHAGRMFPVIIRYNGSEFKPGGIDLAMGIELGRIMQSAGADALHITANGETERNLEIITPGAKIPSRLGGRFHKPGWLIEDVARHVKQAVTIPVIGVSRIDSMECAKRYIEDGSADFIAIGRALIASPEMVREKGATKCLFVNHCTQRVIINKPISCVQCKAVGR
ncbi:NADH:flavin oxidoreductase [Burkholderia cepacia]|uniref:NADH:flavin oxidoreductase n=1 Tax=Burkholderia cepacia TaxID=292 RepID=UPI001CF1BB83|nr:NADH:flavin oxidoreductase [Burkholderia cepacia]MCA8350732.1 NADH:flavin oxidoreductase [Burkholderia cepacia]